MKQDSIQTTKHPSDTLRAEAWRDFSSDKGWKSYLVTSEQGDTHTIKVRKNNRRILDTLRTQPVLCASPVRISDVVHILKRDYGVNIETRMFENDTATDRARYGAYFLTDTVTPLPEGV